jgi:hypothetical protein
MESEPPPRRQRLVQGQGRVRAALPLVFVGAFLAVKVLSPSGDKAPGATNLAAASPGTHLRFVQLAGQHSNRCEFQPSDIATQERAGRLQGACCSSMDESTYRWQVRFLRRYRRIPQIPRDPYDVPVRLTKRLLRYRSTAVLGPRGRVDYRRVMSMTREKGPCCCHCWRWEAFNGLSRYLIARRRWRPAQVAGLIDALDGCGGHSRPPPRRLG